MKKILLILILFASTFCFSCQQKVNDEMIKISPDQKSDIVLYFKKGTSYDDIYKFSENVIGFQRTDGRGHDLLKGMQGTFQVRNQDYEGFAIELRENITTEERQNILNAINSSPLVYKVFENVVPNEIILDAAKAKKEKEDLEKAKNDNRPRKPEVIANSGENK